VFHRKISNKINICFTYF